MSDREQLIDQTTSGLNALDLSLTAGQIKQLVAYLLAMLDENTRINVTAIRDAEDAVRLHLLDSLTVVTWWHSLGHTNPPESILDLGTGGGFPAAPLAIAWPKTKVVAIDGTRKKIGVVERCSEAAGIKNLTGVHTRGSDYKPPASLGAEGFELVTARAVGYSAKLLREVYRLVRPGGWVCLMKGPEPTPEELRAAERFCVQKKMHAEPVYSIAVPGLDARTILGFRK
ncbi:MAG: 16S rRNA (guanine(527)-N(7))-methyltransferase RsmG [Planctomycetaceae bacterium]|nr:16S rRNA (guanine(527)-N(7))-methyltransferase RsmG [Planctomycetaceae bacterium]MCB9954207.1 16S rRNA (guanine(527)-N(7))-methyltransferase RsmG [Planctomycetaceae bacterium]